MKTIKYLGETYYATGKRGTHVATGAATCEYESGSTRGLRLWADRAGRVVEVG